MDFDAIGRNWLKTPIFFGEKAGFRSLAASSFDALYLDEISSIADIAITLGNEFSKLVNCGVAVKYEDLRKHFHELTLFDVFHVTPKAKEEKGDNDISLQKEKSEIFKPSGMCIEIFKPSNMRINLLFSAFVHRF